MLSHELSWCGPPPGPPTHPYSLHGGLAKVVSMTKTEMAYQRLSAMIETGQLAAGAILSEAELMDLVEIGRTPLREATQRLSRDHLVKLKPGSGIEVPSLAVDEQLSRLEVRRSLEMLAVGLACQRGTEEQLEQVASHAKVLDDISNVTDYIAGIRRSHGLICEAAHNGYLADAMTPLQVLSRRFWLAHITDGEREIRQGRELYVTALRAVVDRDAQAAREGIQGLNDHLVNSALEVARRLADQGREQADQT